MQLVVEYDPEPPFDSGSPLRADSQTKRLAAQVMLGGESRLKVMVRGAKTIIKADAAARACGIGLRARGRASAIPKTGKLPSPL